MKVVIVEDEELMARDLAQSLTKVNSDIQIVTILSSVQQSIEFFSKGLELDLIFCDIELKDGKCFEIFKQVEIRVPVIFCTAYDEYALEAFENNGLMYILKPFSLVTLHKALDKYLWMQKSLTRSTIGIEPIDYSHLTSSNKISSIVVRHRDKILPIAADQIAFIFIEHSIVYLTTLDQDIYILQKSLEEMENMLGNNFFRVNRQYLINRESILQAWQGPYRKLGLTFKFNNSKEVFVSKEKVSAFIQWLEF